ncbi:unannotated protein [freshwater metagenome]|uniref:Unannotated protein n=1 Tax=freshwater metagenome TaxID=449393 RepID=A0A6J7FX74_9ZZZZ|nr:hypothetical protein [Actinomycetota bacterium]MSV86467.1 hypothetical protein [Actinomycetota bacterium]MSW68049.1 hypothetical protein [Actinomycetota bacterium]MSX27844.1 hypothetical protein [Actinomycetota bacterium]MSY03176.1 hypothetical protein [Actinomycetota bacterium]
MIKYTITSGTPTDDEKIALEEALKSHERPETARTFWRSKWGTPRLRKHLHRKK